MGTKLAIDGRLILEAQRLRHHVTTTEAVTAALEEYSSRRKQLDILRSFGTIEYYTGYDYKGERTRKRK